MFTLIHGKYTITFDLLNGNYYIYSCPIFDEWRANVLEIYDKDYTLYEDEFQSFLNYLTEAR